MDPLCCIDCSHGVNHDCTRCSKIRRACNLPSFSWIPWALACPSYWARLVRISYKRSMAISWQMFAPLRTALPFLRWNRETLSQCIASQWESLHLPSRDVLLSPALPYKQVAVEGLKLVGSMVLASENKRQRRNQLTWTYCDASIVFEGGPKAFSIFVARTSFELWHPMVIVVVDELALEGEKEVLAISHAHDWKESVSFFRQNRKVDWFERWVWICVAHIPYLLFKCRDWLCCRRPLSSIQM